MIKNKRPKPFQVGPLRVRVIRGPREQDGAWYFRAERYIDGKSTTTWSGWGHRDAVTRILAGLVAEGKETEPQGRRADRVETVQDLLEVWLGQQLERKISENTKRNNLKCSKHLTRGIGTVLLTRLDRSVLQDYVESRLREDAAAGTVTNEISTIVQAWRWGVPRSEVGLPPRQLVRPTIKRKYKLSRFVPDPVEFWRVFDAVPAERVWVRTMLVVMEGCGARPGAIADLRWEDINWQTRRVHLRNKGKERRARLADGALNWLRDLREDPVELRSGRILDVSPVTGRKGLRGFLVTACREAGVPFFQPKQVRTMVENRLFDAGADPGVVSAQLGHSEQVSLRHYRRAKGARVDEVLFAAGLGERPEADRVVSLADHKRRKDA